MQVTLWYFADCPSWRSAEQRLRQALDQIGRTDVEIRLVQVETEAKAAEVGFAGSPTFTVDGIDLFGGALPAAALACRIYRTPYGLASVPEVADLAAALLEKVPT